jgi:NTE family protein
MMYLVCGHVRQRRQIMTGKQIVNAVFEGGGVKGVGLVGAVAVTEEKGYQFGNVAGTSAGSIVSSLIAAGYTGIELKEILDSLDYERFKDKDFLDKLPILGPIASVGFEKGLYEGKFFEGWLNELLEAKGIRTFGDLINEDEKDNPKLKYKLQVVAADCTRGEMLILPGDIKRYGILPESMGVARAVRMSMSIPFFFEPIQLQDASTGAMSYIVDGGVLSNYPVGIFDDDSIEDPRPTLGYKLVEPGEGKPREIKGPISLFSALFSTMMEAHDARYIQDHNFARTIPIKTLGVGTTDFGITRDKSEALFQSGRDAATDFFERWDYGKWKEKYSDAELGKRRLKVME